MPYPKMPHEDCNAISVKPKVWGAGWGAPPAPNAPAQPVPGSVNPTGPKGLAPTFKQEFECEYNKPPAGIPVEDDPNKGTGDTNYCKTDIISTCTCPMVKKNWAEHVICKFAYKASNADRCMYFVHEEFCDSLGAQKAAGTGTKTLTDCMGL